MNGALSVPLSQYRERESESQQADRRINQRVIIAELEKGILASKTPWSYKIEFDDFDKFVVWRTFTSR